MARLVAEVRGEAGERLHAALSSGVDADLAGRLEALLVVPEGSRWSELDRLRRAPTRASGPQMVAALHRAAEITAIGVDAVDVSGIPPGRLAWVARQGLIGNAAMLRRLPQARRTATLVATVRALQVAAVDDALDLFAVLMATKLIGPAERASVKDRLRSLPQLREASANLAAVVRVLLEQLSTAEADARSWEPERAGEQLFGRCRGSGSRLRS